MEAEVEGPVRSRGGCGLGVVVSQVEKGDGDSVEMLVLFGANESFQVMCLLFFLHGALQLQTSSPGLPVLRSPAAPETTQPYIRNLT